MFELPALPQPAGSFRPEFRRRVPGYRTPSPPRHAVEPLSPLGAPRGSHAETTSEAVSKKRSHDHFEAHNAHTEDHWPAQDTRSFSFRGHRASHPGPTPIDTRASAHPQPSALDIFATIATSPSLAARDHFSSFQYPSPNAFAADHMSKSHHFERASKRSRSEVINQRPVFGYESRPTTSHVYPSPFSPTSPPANGFSYGYNTGRPSERFQSSVQHNQEDEVTLRQDAELLLSISRGFANRKPVVDSQPKHLPNGLDPRRDSFPSTSSPRIQYTRGFGGAPGADARYQYYERDVDMMDDAGDPTVDGKFIGPTISRGNGVPSKPKDHRGWPKGKPRGPRNVGADGKKKAKTTRKPDTTNSEKTATKVRCRTNDSGSTIAAQRKSSPYEIPCLDVDPEVKRPRRASDTRLKHYDKEFGSREDFEKSRRVSAPPKAMTPPPQPGQKKPRSRREPQLDICAACKKNRNATDGLHELWINCNGCKSWFHTTCAGFYEEKKVKDVDKFYCEGCKPDHGPTTFVRKSSRAHASVDYAGLHEGKIRTADDIPDHHYIEPIKNGTIEFQPETFPRMPPELVNQEYLEKCGEWTEPILIPAELNPRPAQDGNAEPSVVAHNEAESHPISESSVFSEEYEYDCVFDEGQDGLDMVIPRGLTVRQVANLYGPEEKVDVIDVKLQEGEDKRWTMRQWADYYEAEGDKPVRNVISLEVSQSILGKLIRRPKVVRDLDLQDSVWPKEEKVRGVFPPVQFYCLMSVADCYTDFHIDFGGSSVYYHILKGRKTFFFIPPKPKHLKRYEEWCNSPDQNAVFLGNETKECYRVDLYPGDTMLIPSGWIHAVWTPENSLVIGGNFLTRMHYGMQITVNEIEKATNVTRKFRYPFFQKVLWFAVVRYLQHDPVPSTVVDRLCRGHQFERKEPVYFETGDDGDEGADASDDVEHFNARYYSQSEVDGLPDLVRYVYRTVMIALGKLPGISKKTQDAVQRSMPKECGDHLSALRTFAMWVAWKRGNENIPAWAYPDAPIDDLDASATEKKPSATAQRRLERQAVHEAMVAAGTRRTSLRTPSKAAADAEPSSLAKSAGDENVKIHKPADGRRVACDACRRRRRRCTHNGNDEAAVVVPEPPSAQGRFGVKTVHPPNMEDIVNGSPSQARPASGPTVSNYSSTASQSVSGSSSRPQWTSAPQPMQYPVSATWSTDMPTTPKPVTQSPSSNSAAPRYVSKPPKSRACDACRKSKVSVMRLRLTRCCLKFVAYKFIASLYSQPLQ